MAGPSWLAGILAGIMIITAVYCASRLVIASAQRRATERDVDLVHVVMGVATAGLLVPRLNPLWSGAWAVVFAAATAWFGGRVVRGYRVARPDGFVHAHHVPHLVMSGAMVYMLVAVSSSGPDPGMAKAGTAGSAAHLPPVALMLALFMIGYVMWVGDRLPALAPVRAWTAAADGAPVPASGPGGRGRGGSARGGSRPGGSGPGGAAARGSSARGGVVRGGSAHGDSAHGDSAHGDGARKASARPPLSPRLAACCEIAMGLTMGYMLILMV